MSASGGKRTSKFEEQSNLGLSRRVHPGDQFSVEPTNPLPYLGDGFSEGLSHPIIFGCILRRFNQHRQRLIVRAEFLSSFDPITNRGSLVKKHRNPTLWLCNSAKHWLMMALKVDVRNGSKADSSSLTAGMGGEPTLAQLKHLLLQ